MLYHNQVDLTETLYSNPGDDCMCKASLTLARILFPQCRAMRRAKSWHFSGVKFIRTARWRIVCVMSCHLSRISYELFTKYVTPSVMTRMCISQCSGDKSWHLGKIYWTFQNFCHDTARTTSPDFLRCKSFNRSTSFLSMTIRRCDEQNASSDWSDNVLERDREVLMRMDVLRLVVIISVSSQTKSSGLPAGRYCLSTADDAITTSGSY